MRHSARQDELWTRKKEEERNTEGHHREKGETGLSYEHCGPFVTCAWVNESPLLASLSVMHCLGHRHGAD